jgi:hypothetical protein
MAVIIGEALESIFTADRRWLRRWKILELAVFASTHLCASSPGILPRREQNHQGDDV